MSAQQDAETVAGMRWSELDSDDLLRKLAMAGLLAAVLLAGWLLAEHWEGFA